MPFRREGAEIFWAPGLSLDWHKVVVERTRYDRNNWEAQAAFERELGDLLDDAKT